MTKIAPLLSARSITVSYGQQIGCQDIDFDLWKGEVLCVVGESGAGKSTLLKSISAQQIPTSGTLTYRPSEDAKQDIYSLKESERRKLIRTEWAYVHQNSRDGLRMAISAAGNVGEKLMDVGWRHYGNICATAEEWLEKVEIPTARLNDPPSEYSDGMQQRLQIARNLVTDPTIVFMDEPTSGLDVSVQAKLLDLWRSLVTRMGLSVVIVTHDMSVARLLSHRLMVMQNGKVCETGLTDQVLDDPQHPYTQRLVSSIIQT